MWGFWVFIAFFIPFAIFILILNSSLVVVFYQNYLTHTILLALVCMLAFSASYFAYHVFSGNKDFKILILSMIFYIFGFLFFIHGSAIPGFLLLSEEAFDATEHFSLFLGAIFFLAMFFPFKKHEAFIYKNRLRVFVALNAFLVSFFVILATLPRFAAFLAGSSDFFIGSTGVLLLAVIFLLADQYQQNKSIFLFFLMAGCATLINVGIMPFFYYEWNVLWWYFHLVFIMGFSIILIGLVKSHKKTREEEKVFTSVPFFLKIATKIQISAALGIIAISAILFVGYQTIADLTKTFHRVQEEAFEMHKITDISISLSNMSSLAVYRMAVSGEAEKKYDIRSLTSQAEKDFKALESFVIKDPQDEQGAFLKAKDDYDRLKLKVEEAFSIDSRLLNDTEIKGMLGEILYLYKNAATSLEAWHNIAEQESLSIEEKFMNIQWMLVFYGVFLLLFLMVYAPVSWLMILNWTVYPLKSLVNATKQIASGDTKVRAEVFSRDELGFLAENFNIMTEKLVHANQYITGVINIMPVALIVTDKDGNITTLNSFALKILKYNEKEILGKNITNIFLTRYLETKATLFENLKLQDLAKNGYVNDVRVVFLDSKSEEIPVALSAVLLKENTNINSIIFIAKDMRELTEHLKSRLAEFVSIASHQLRTPLTSMKLFIEMLAKGDVGEMNKKQKEYVDNVQKSTSRMINLVNDLLSVSRVESGTLSVNPELVQLEVFIQGLLDELKTYASYKHCNLGFEKPKTPFQKIPLDANLMRQVFNNIFSNAIKYSPENRCDISISMEEVNGEYILISIADKGIGIPTNLQSRVFEKFFRADNALKTDVEGTGLGLYVVKMILNLFGGTVWFESRENVGTTFYITIPLKGMIQKIEKQAVSKV